MIKQLNHSKTASAMKSKKTQRTGGTSGRPAAWGVDKEQDEPVVVEQQIDEEEDERTKTQSISLQNCISKLKHFTFYKV